MLEKLEKLIKDYTYISKRANQRIAELKHKKDSVLRSYWAGIMNVCNLMITDLEKLRTFIETTQQSVNDGLDVLRGK